jgi:hypothetical protein
MYWADRGDYHRGGPVDDVAKSLLYSDMPHSHYVIAMFLYQLAENFDGGKHVSSIKTESPNFV